MAKFSTFDFKGLSPAARKAVNESFITRGKATKDGLHPVTVKIAGVVLGPFPSLQDAHDETKKWLIKKFPSKSTDSVDSIAAKYGRQVQQNDFIRTLCPQDVETLLLQYEWARKNQPDKSKKLYNEAKAKANELRNESERVIKLAKRLLIL